MPISPLLSQFLRNPYLREDEQLKELILKADQRQDAIFYASNFWERKSEYISKMCERKLGYEQSEFIKKGPDFIYEITDKEMLPSIIATHHNYVKQMRQPGFDPKEFILHEYPAVMINKQQEKVTNRCLGIMLTFRPEADFEFGVAFFSDDTPEAIQESKRMLKQIKERHNQVFDHPPIRPNSSPLTILPITNERRDQKITARERQVLQLLAQGLSTTDIARELNITVNTAETHRKHLLEKFEAKNAAELIKKASKVFWLE